MFLAYKKRRDPFYQWSSKKALQFMRRINETSSHSFYFVFNPAHFGILKSQIHGVHYTHQIKKTCSTIISARTKRADRELFLEGLSYNWNWINFIILIWLHQTNKKRRAKSDNTKQLLITKRYTHKENKDRFLDNQ